MPGFDNNTVYADNYDFRGVQPVLPQVSVAGQLPVGTGASPAILVGAITSPLGTLTVGYSSPNITLDLVGGSTAIDSVVVDTTTGAGTNPVLPTIGGQITMTGGQYPTGTFGTRVITINSSAPNTIQVDAQISSAVAATAVTKNGLSHFDSADFTVDASGFVSLSGTLGQTLTGDTGGALSPTAGNWNILSQPTAGASVTFDGLVSTLSFNVTDANSNTYIGSLVGYNNTLGVGNTGLGYSAFQQVTSGSNNVGLGYGALNKLLDGSTNTAVGVNCLNQITSPNNNVAIGYAAGSNITTGGSNILIGVSAGTAFASTEHSNIVIGHSLGTLTDTNTIRIGFQGAAAGQQNKCFVAGIVGITVANEQFVTIDSTTGQLGIRTSSGVGETITGDSGGALSPTAGNWNILGRSGSKTSGSGSTLTLKSPPYADQGGSTTVTLNSGSFATAAITLTTPATAGLADGDLLEFVATNGVLVVQLAATQVGHLGSVATSVAGTFTSTATGDALCLRYQASTNDFWATSSIGVWTLA